jgi:hypothetical protein
LKRLINEGCTVPVCWPFTVVVLVQGVEHGLVYYHTVTMGKIGLTKYRNDRSIARGNRSPFYCSHHTLNNVAFAMYLDVGKAIGWYAGCPWKIFATASGESTLSTLDPSNGWDKTEEECQEMTGETLVGVHVLWLRPSIGRSFATVPSRLANE